MTQMAIKLCECGCGKAAPIATQTNTALGHVKGQPMRFVRGHARRRRGVRELWLPDRNGCWMWQLSTNDRGYGLAWDGSKLVKAHRLVYEQEVGPIPEGKVLDHRCFVLACVNPEHMEPIEQAENIRRGRQRQARAIDYLTSEGFSVAVGDDEARRVLREIGRL